MPLFYCVSYVSVVVVLVCCCVYFIFDCVDNNLDKYLCDKSIELK